MSPALRLGTRASALALAQSSTVAASLHARCGLSVELVEITTTGDKEQTATPGSAPWSTNAFISEIERALLDGRVDLAVHSYKDMATQTTPGLTVAAVPEREAAHDVIVCRSRPVAETVRRSLENGASAERVTIGTSSPRRSAQLRGALACSIEPVRGNVPTRIDKLMSPDTPYDAVCLAAAGLNRLRIAPEHAVDLPTDRFPTAAAQGAIAVQTRTDGTLATTVARLEHTRTRRAAEAERQFLRSIEAGCHTPAAAYATDEEGATLLRTQYFTPDGARFDAEARAADPIEAGRRCAQETLEWLSART